MNPIVINGLINAPSKYDEAYREEPEDTAEKAYIVVEINELIEITF